jgi:hypothetical protein
MRLRKQLRIEDIHSILQPDDCNPSDKFNVYLLYE